MSSLQDVHALPRTSRSPAKDLPILRHPNSHDRSEGGRLAAALLILLAGIWLIWCGVTRHFAPMPLIEGGALILAALTAAFLLAMITYDNAWILDPRGLVLERRNLLGRKTITYRRDQLQEVRLDVRSEYETRVWVKLTTGQSLLAYWSEWDQAILVAARLGLALDLPRRMALVTTPVRQIGPGQGLLTVEHKRFAYSSDPASPLTWVLDKPGERMLREQGESVQEFSLRAVAGFRIERQTGGLWHAGGKGGDYYLYQYRVVMVPRSGAPVLIALTESGEAAQSSENRAHQDAEWIVSFLNALIGKAPIDYLLQGLS